MTKPQINLHNQDCMQAMAAMGDNAYDLAIVDPPYGLDIAENGITTNGAGGKAPKYNRNFYGASNWDSASPSRQYFQELQRVSRKQVIWGGNYFLEHLSATSCFLIWDKDNGAFSTADAEIAWTNFKSAIRKFTYTWCGFRKGPSQQSETEPRIHITQKPVALYKWVLKSYASEGDRILDTHLGSGSIAIACHDLGFDLEGYEIDQEYHQAALERLNTHRSQLQIF